MKPDMRILILLLISLLPLSAVIAQELPQEFNLPFARLGQDYRVELEGVLRDKYRLRVDAGHANAVVLWAMGSGEMPAGLSIRTDGTIIGNARDARVGPYHFSLKAVDIAVREEPLELRFSMEVKAGRVRLTRLDGPRLAPVDTVTPVNAMFNHPSSAAASTIEATDTLEKSETKSVDREPPAKDEKETAAESAPDIRKVANAEAEDRNNPFSSMNKRFVLGVEQSGAASAKSQGKPFLNLFINTPLVNDDNADPVNKLPLFSFWGDVRLTSTPSQIKAFANISSAAIDTIIGGEANELVMGFDFVVGPEFRIKRFENRTLNFIAAFGAVSPLSPKDSVELFEVPDENSSQAEAFFKEFPGAKEKEHIAFVAPERDRFLRQYYAGIRFRDYTTEKTKIQNVFPSMLDVTFGQSEAVTGGKLHKFVVGIDGFYVLPFPTEYQFLYLFGSAKFKVGGGKSIKAPFLLDTSASSVKVTDPSVFIADPVPSNRDVYRIGFGVDLIELFRRQER